MKTERTYVSKRTAAPGPDRTSQRAGGIAEQGNSPFTKQWLDTWIVCWESERIDRDGHRRAVSEGGDECTRLNTVCPGVGIGESQPWTTL